MSAAADHFWLSRSLALGCLLLLQVGSLLAGLPLINAADAGFGAYTADVAFTDVFPDADKFGPIEGSPPAAAAYRRGEVVGYVFDTSDIGYSGKPIKIRIGLDNAGMIVGAKVVEHHEPILLIGIPQERLFEFVGRYVGHNVVELSKARDGHGVDAISGATVTAVVINDSVMRTALKLAKSRGIAGFAASPASAHAARAPRIISTLAEVPYAAADWAALVGDGSIRRLHLLNGDVDAAFKKIGVGSPEPYAEAGKPEDLFIDMYVGLSSIESVGRSLLSRQDFDALKSWLGPKQAAIVIAANGAYSFRGSGFVRGGIFDRLQITQDDTTILFKDKDYRRLDTFSAAGSPVFKEVGLFRLPASTNFDPAKPFRVELLVQRPIGPIKKAFTNFSLAYQLPARFLRTVEALATDDGSAARAPSEHDEASNEARADTSEADAPAPTPMWVKIWQSRVLDIVIMGLCLLILTLIFFLQDWLVRRPLFFTRLRTGFLVFSVLWLGLYAKAQLSVVNIFTFTNAVITGFRWDFFLLEPIIFMLWCATAVSLLFWGRGAYCGWLCPFGALQELLNDGARRLGIRQISVSHAWHERLSALKYVLFLGLFGVALGNMALAEQLAEIEPFKTVVLLRFARDLPFVLFALALLTAGLFIERFYCRYLCVLGAGLAIPGRGRMFDWLKRRKQCGYECQLCAKQCRVQAIAPLGQINPNECIYCMQCQVTYWDDHRCPPLIMKREGRGKKSRPAASVPPLTPVVDGGRPPAPIKMTIRAKETADVER